MATVETIYRGSLRTEATHLQSGSHIITDAPTDNHGMGASFSPTDLLATALGSCMLTVMGIAANAHQFSIDRTTVETTKTMVENPRRVYALKLDFKFPLGSTYSEKQKLLLEKSAKTCPVYLSLHPDIQKTITFSY